MKKIILLLLGLSAVHVRALDYTYSTAGFGSVNGITNTYIGTNAADGNRDSWETYVWKLNHNDTWLAGQLLPLNALAITNAVADSNIVVSVRNKTIHIGGLPGTGGSSGAGGVTNFIFTNTTTLAAGTSATATNVGIIGGVAYITLGLPRGASGTNTITNTVTAYAFSNQLLSSRQITVFATNYAFWSGSNYIGRVAGVVDWILVGGDDGGNPPGVIPVSLVGSYTGTNAWFTLTNNFVTASNISLAVITNGFSYAGGGIVNPGNLQVFSLDHWELYHRSNDLDYQYFRKKDAPARRDDVVNKAYADDLFTGAFNQNFSTVGDTNGFTVTRYLFQNKALFELAGRTTLTNIVSCAASGFQTDPATGATYPTNIILTTTTNLPVGWVLQSQTNLAQTFFNFTNYILTTNAGFLNFSIAILPEPQRFFRLVVGSSDWAAIHTSLTVDGLVTINGGLTVSQPSMQNYSTNVSLIAATSLRIYFSPGFSTTNFTVSAPNSLAASYVSGRGTNYFDVMFTAITLSGVTVEGVVLKR